MRKLVLALVIVLLPAAVTAQDAAPIAQWVQMTPDGGQEARAVTPAASCPAIVIDGKDAAMNERAAPDAYFAVRLCSAILPAKAKTASISGTALPLLKHAPHRIMVFGDTGCRIKGQVIQNCNDPVAWPFAQIAARAAQLKPDLVIHVGDYLYRESPCPDGDKRCAGTPYGDNWPAWAADFFTPAAPLLAASPWVIVRGNHEDCQRSGPGWLRLLGPLPVNPVAGCNGHVPLYSVPLGDVTLAVMDDADAPDTNIDSDLRTEYEADFDALGKIKGPTWLVGHRPIWGAVTLYGTGVGGNRTLIAALPHSSVLASTSLMVSGHIHTFEILNYDDKALPPQLIAGFGGDALDATPADLTGLNLSGTRVKNGLSIGGFGFLMMTRENDGWLIDVYTKDGAVQRQCHFAHRKLDCPKA